MLINLEKVAIFKHSMKSLSSDEKCKALIKNIADFLKKYSDDQEYAQPCIQLIKFCKKLSKQSAAHSHLVEADLHGIALQHISASPLVHSEMDEVDLKGRL